MKKPFEKYLGSKEANGTLHTIINHIPEHQIYIEGFLGNGAILRNKKPAELLNIGIDYNAGVIDKWVLNASEKIFKTKMSLPYASRAEQDKSNYTAANSFQFIHGNFLDLFPFMEAVLIGKSVFIYLDPPYVLKTRTSKARYKKELTDEAHKKLVSMIARSKFKILVSCYDNDIYQSNLSTWNKFSYQAMTRGGLRTETVYYNYEITSLHQYDFLGKDCTDRQRIKRKVSRLVSKLKKLPVLEARSVIDGIICNGSPK